MSVRITRTTVEHLLDAGLIQVAMSHGKWWTIRRNGKTQTWKTRPNDFRIPYKMGLKLAGALTQSDMVAGEILDEAYYRIDPAQVERATELCAYLAATKGA